MNQPAKRNRRPRRRKPAGGGTRPPAPQKGQEKPQKGPPGPTNGSRNRSNGARKNRPRRKPPQEGQPKKTYKVLIYDTFMQAKSDLANIEKTKAECDQLNIVIRQEGNMDDPDLTPHGMVYAGAAWTLIHERRIEEGWYNEAH